MIKATLTKESIYFRLAYRCRALVHYHHDGKHGSIQDMVLAKELRVLHLDLTAVRLSSAGSQEETLGRA